MPYNLVHAVSCRTCKHNIVRHDRRGLPDTVCRRVLQGEIAFTQKCYNYGHRYWEGLAVFSSNVEMWPQENQHG